MLSFLPLALTCLAHANRLHTHRLADAHPAGETLRVLQMNVWLDGSKVENGISRIADIIAAAEADIVTLQEVRQKENPHFLDDLTAALLNKSLRVHAAHAGGDVAVVSRWPILDVKMVFNRFVMNDDLEIVDDHGSVVACRVKSPLSNKELLVVAAHLDFEDYAVYLPRGYQASSPFGRLPEPITDVAAMESVSVNASRLPALHAVLDYLQNYTNLPVILGGDFNDASHLDWTPALRDQYDHHGVVFEFPTSKLLTDAGLVDAWRERHSDPMTHPGITWPSQTLNNESTSWASEADERDRIDYVYFRSAPGPRLLPKEAVLVGSRGYYAYGAPIWDHADPHILEEMPWPTDHKAVLVQFEFTE